MISEQLRTDIQSTIKGLKDLKELDCKAVLGLDGFIDEIVHIVDKRQDVNNYTKIDSMQEYGKRIIKAAGLSTNMEMVPVKVKLGGNGPILSNALAHLGLDVTYIGALGYPLINDVFKPMEAICSLISIAQPSHTHAIEFDDGKIIMVKTEAFKDINWDNIQRRVGLERLKVLIKECDLFGLENWTMVPYMSDIWKRLLKDILPHLKTREQKPFAFFDLADPEKRKDKDIIEATELIKSFSSYFKVILGLNKKEAFEVARVLGLFPEENIRREEMTLKQLNIAIAESMGIHCVVIHPVDCASAVVEDQYFETKGPYTSKPKLTTGAGDNFNAGFCYGQAL
ncbi:MAG: hypothetical protein ACOYEJ_09180, partial [Mahellales bacterium]